MPEGHRRAVGYFQEALEADGDFALAMAGLAGSRLLVGLDDPESGADALERAREDAARALELDSGSLEVQDVLALIERSIPRVTVPESPPPSNLDFDTAWVVATTRLGSALERRMHREGMERGFWRNPVEAPGTPGQLTSPWMEPDM